MPESSLSRRDFLRYGAGTVAGAAVLPSLARTGLFGRDAVRLPDATSFSYTMWNYDSPASVAQIKQMEAAYNKLGKAQISINISSLPGSGATLYPSKIQSLITSGKPPDLFRDWVGTLASPFIDEGAVQPLTAWYAKYGWDKVVAAPAIGYVTRHGKPWGVPIGLNSIAVWYYKPSFEKAGVSIPTTYDEWEKVNTTLVKKGITPAGEAAIDGWDVMRLFEHLLEVTAGPKLHDQLSNLEASWSNPAVVDAFALLKKWSDQGWLEKGWLGTNPTDSGDLFTGGKVAQQMQGPWEIQTLSSGGANLAHYDLFPPPGANGPARLGGFAEQYMISTHVTGARLDALGDFLNWWIQPTQTRKYFYAGETATIDGVPGGNSPSAVLAQKAASMSKYGGYLIQDEALGTALASSYFSVQQAVGAGSMTPQEAATKMQAAVSASKKKGG